MNQFKPSSYAWFKVLKQNIKQISLSLILAFCPVTFYKKEVSGLKSSWVIDNVISP